MIRALIFDFDGLIIDTESALIQAYADVHEAHGVAFDHQHFLNAIGHADYAFDPWHAFSREADRQALEEDRRSRNRVHNLRLEPLPGVLNLIATARSRGLQLGLASNSGREHCQLHLTRLGLFESFSFLACRGEAPSPKPEPDLYRLVLQRFGLRGHEAIAFEDSHTGSLAAKRAGLHVVAIPGVATAHHDFRHVDHRVESMAALDLEELLARFLPTPHFAADPGSSRR